MIQKTLDLAEVKARHPLDRVVEAAEIKLTGRGNVWQGRCPFHDEANGSFTVYLDTQKFWCFGCGAGGDVLDFVRRLDGLSLAEAVEKLEGGAYPVGAVHGRSGPRKAPKPRPPADPAVLTAAARFYSDRLRGDACEGARLYLESRGINEETVRGLGIGYAPGEGLADAMRVRGIGLRQLGESGLLRGKGRERFADAVVVPEVQDRRVTWLVARNLDPLAPTRFQALPGSKPVLGLARLGLTPPDVVLTEGLFDWVTLCQWGMPGCALLGTHGLEKAARALASAGRVFLAFDADDGGREAAKGLKELLGDRGAVVTLPEGVKDVAELAVIEDGRARFRAALVDAWRGRRAAAPV